MPVKVQSLPGPQRPAAQQPSHQPPLAQVVHAGKDAKDWDPEALRVKLDNIQKDVHSIKARQKPPPTEDLDTTRLAVDEIVGTLEHAQQQVTKAKRTEEELSKQIQDKKQYVQEVERRIRDNEQRLQEVAEEQDQDQRGLSLTARDVESFAAGKEADEEELRNTQRVNEATRSFAEQMEERCRELEGCERELGERLREAAESGLRAKAAIAELQAELEEGRHREEAARQQADFSRQRQSALREEAAWADEQQALAEQSRAVAEAELHQQVAESREEAERMLQTSDGYCRQLREAEEQLRHPDMDRSARPEDVLKAATEREEESLFTENSRLKKVITRLQCDLFLCVRKQNEQRDIIKKYQGQAAGQC